MIKILEEEDMDSILNHTFIALIPKVQKPKYVHEFKLISLSNFLYKLVSKVLVNWLKPFMSSTISCNQIAFIF